ncbi:hypothetical protein GW17_00017417 [Ensete ventricosum]|nr:hypothetical protein GW17_00017417 [Ensete ventricosum]
MRSEVGREMELFSSQPDLSLQISPPDMTPASGCRKPDEDMDLGFMRSNSMTTALMEKAESNTSEVSLAARSASVSTTTSNTTLLLHPLPHHHHHHLHFHHHHHHHPLLHQGYHQDLSLLRPIRGIPVYQNPPTLPLMPPYQQQQQQLLCDSSPSTDFNHFATTQGLSRSRYWPSRFPIKRSMRGPRMRWTSALHARFVHAVELLGGHETLSFFLLQEMPSERFEMYCDLNSPCLSGTTSQSRLNLDITLGRPH